MLSSSYIQHLGVSQALAALAFTIPMVQQWFNFGGNQWPLALKFNMISLSPQGSESERPFFLNVFSSLYNII